MLAAQSSLNVTGGLNGRFSALGAPAEAIESVDPAAAPSISPPAAPTTGPDCRVQVLVVGAGPCGLGAAERLTQLGASDWLVLEADDVVGGHARSVTDQAGFTWDIGGHVQYSTSEPYNDLLDRLLPEGTRSVERNSSAWRQGAFVPYPYQLNIAALPPDERDAALADLEKAALVFPALAADGRLTTFGKYLYAKFGRTICDGFLVPYNRKAWATDPDEMGTYWVRDFLADVDIEEVRRRVAVGEATTGWGYNATFRYPSVGGCGEVWRRLGDELAATGRIRLGVRLASLDIHRRQARLTTGDTVHYDQLVTTVPLDDLCTMTGEPELVALSRRLRASQVLVIGFGLDGHLPEMLAGRSWVYFANEDFPAHRVSVSSNLAAANVGRPGEQYSLLCEIAAPPGADLNADVMTVRTLRWLMGHDFIGPYDKVASLWWYGSRVGYPTPTLDRGEVLDAINATLEPFGIHSRGRNGTWVYETSNQDSTYLQGRTAIDQLVG